MRRVAHLFGLRKEVHRLFPVQRCRQNRMPRALALVWISMDALYGQLAHQDGQVLVEEGGTIPHPLPLLPRY